MTSRTRCLTNCKAATRTHAHRQAHTAIHMQRQQVGHIQRGYAHTIIEAMNLGMDAALGRSGVGLRCTPITISVDSPVKMIVLILIGFCTNNYSRNFRYPVAQACGVA